MFNPDYFSRPITEALKGYLALGVLLHHIYLNTQIVAHDSVPGFFLGSLGGYCVSLFFFISGYGLLTSFNNRGGVPA
jgi:peptidoglycan/LPS O-acetylase OafA/YrhL